MQCHLLIPNTESWTLILQIKELLPNLAKTEFSIVPSQTQLAMMLREGGPAAIKQVANFTVQHRTHGSVKWLEPVDVTGLQLADLVIISWRNIDVSTLCLACFVWHATTSHMYLQTVCMHAMYYQDQWQGWTCIWLVCKVHAAQGQVYVQLAYF